MLRLTSDSKGDFPNHLHDMLEEVDGQFVFTIDGANKAHVSLNAQALTKALDRERDNVKTLQGKVSAIPEDFDMERAREALAKYEEMSKWTPDQKVQEQIEAAKRELAKVHQTELEKLGNKSSKYRSQLEEQLVRNAAVSAITKHKGNSTLLLPHVTSQARMVEGADGKFHVEVVGSDGVARSGASDGSPMTIEQLVSEMTTSEDFQTAFGGNGASGSGASQTGNNGGGVGSGGTRTIRASDVLTSRPRLEDLASGKVHVVSE